MAITRSQQAKQMLQNGGMLVKPGFGGTRQGYRGDAAARSSGARDSGRVGGRDVGESSTRSDPRDPGPDRSAVGAGSQFARNRAREALREQRKRAIEAISPSTKFSNRLISGALGALTPFGIGRFVFNKAIDQTAMGYGKTPSITDDEDDNFEDRDRGGDEPFIPMMATPFQQDVIKKTAEEISPIELAIQQRDALAGPRAFAKEGGIMDLETGRQMYFLGKLVKKAKRAIKKVTKSPLGKAALVGAAAFVPFGEKGSLFRRFMDTGIGSSVGDFFSNMDTKDKLGLAAAAGLTAAPLLFQDDDSEDEYQKFLASRGASGQSLDIQGIRNDPYSFLARPFKAEGGIMRLGFDDGDKDLSKDPNYKGWKKTYETNPDAAEMNENHKRYLNFYERNKNAQAEGSKEPVAKKTMPLLDMGGMEKDYREDGGFVPIGRMEKADDVPARLSKNEFVFTADAVRNAGDGNVDKGAEVMYNMMKNLEAGGEVSEESQGLKGARKMFQTSQRLEEVL